MIAAMIDLRPRTLYFIFQPGCEACEASEPAFSAVVQARPLLLALRLDANGSLVARLPVKIRATPTWLFRVGDQAAMREGQLTAEEISAWIDKIEADLALKGTT